MSLGTRFEAAETKATFMPSSVMTAGPLGPLLWAPPAPTLTCVNGCASAGPVIAPGTPIAAMAVRAVQSRTRRIRLGFVMVSDPRTMKPAPPDERRTLKFVNVYSITEFVRGAAAAQKRTSTRFPS